MMQKIISRGRALSQGLKQYYTGRRCKQGHDSPRYVENYHCVACDEERRKVNRERLRSNWHDWRKRNPEAYRLNNEKHRKANLGLYSAYSARRRAAKLERIPPWEDLKAIKSFYMNTPEGMTVDHEIPLRGKFVSGLHVLSNLSYLTHSENSSKSNNFECWAMEFYDPNNSDPDYLAEWSGYL